MREVTQKKDDKCRSKKPVFISQNAAMHDLVKKIKLVAKTKATVLITGESGTGKEVIAQLLNYHSDRPKNDMVTINCGAIPTELVESELFGHEKGAFTGATGKKEGCFELADKGTLYLDEVGEMPLDVQVKLLRAVELGSFRRVGGKEEVEVDLRLVSATNKTLLDQVKAGSFREDLYYRLNVVELYVPPLRHRKGDIPLLTEFYLNHFTNCYEIDNAGISDACLEMFMDYDWAGNVRELKNVVEHAVVFSKGEKIIPSMLPKSFNKCEEPETTLDSTAKHESDDDVLQISIGTSLEEVERRMIESTLRSVDNNKTEAAKILGFARKTLHNKLDKYQGLG